MNYPLPSIICRSLVALLFLSLSMDPAVAEDTFDGSLGSSVSDYGLQTLEGSPVDLTSLAGSVSLVNLWATWCIPCRAEMPHLDALAQNYKDRGLRVIGISLDAPNRKPRVLKFVEDHTLGFEIWVDSKGKGMSHFSDPSLPTNLLIDREGRVVWRRTGPIAEHDPELVEALEDHLKEPKSSSTSSP